MHGSLVKQTCLKVVLGFQNAAECRTAISFVQNETYRLLRRLPCCNKPTGRILCAKCLGGKKPSETKERTSIANHILNIHPALERQTMWLKL